MFIDFLEREEGGERERNIDVGQKHPSAASVCTPTRDHTWNLGTCPDQESNPQAFGAQDDAPANRAAQLRLTPIFK